MSPRKPLGQILLDAGLLDEFQLKSALGYQKKWGGRLGKVLVENRFVTEQALVQALHEQTGVEVVDLQHLTIPDYLLRLVPLELATRHNLIPVRLEGEPGSSSELLVLAMDDPTNLEALDEVRFRTGKRTAPVLAGESAIQAAIRRWYLKEDPAVLDDKERAEANAASAGLAEGDLVVVQGRLEPGPSAAEPAGDFDPDDPFAQLESLALEPEPTPSATAATARGTAASVNGLNRHPAQSDLQDLPEVTATPLVDASEEVAEEELSELEVIDVVEPEQLPAQPQPSAPPLREVPPSNGKTATAPAMEQLLSRVGLAAGSEPAARSDDPVPASPVAASPTSPAVAQAAGAAAVLPNESEVQQLLEQLESAESVEQLPRILKPSNVVAALVRLLLEKQVFDERELLEELNRQ